MSLVILATVLGVVGLLVVPVAAELLSTVPARLDRRRNRRRHSLEARRFHHDTLGPGFRGRAA